MTTPIPETIDLGDLDPLETQDIALRIVQAQLRGDFDVIQAQIDRLSTVDELVGLVIGLADGFGWVLKTAGNDHWEEVLQAGIDAA